MRLILLGALLALSACDNPTAEAEARLKTVMESGGSNSDICAAAREAAEAWLADGDQAEYYRTRAMRDIYCDAAARDPHGVPPT